ncbi:MAG: radical SAM protein [Planctomycetes bacterium]|nr:radical SAM protein [Planctomycetota bacterium]
MPLELLGATWAEVERHAGAAFGREKGRGAAAPIYRDALRQGTFMPERQGLGAAACMRWREQFTCTLPALRAQTGEPAEHGTVVKTLHGLADGNTIESVSLPMGRGRTSLCLSTQVGCARACTFCETGRQGLQRNLTAAEIVAQVTSQHARSRADTLVFMGMGEPLDNFEALEQALAVLTDRHGLGYAHDRLTICTLGPPAGLRRLPALGYRRLNVNLSLHAADPALRARLLPGTARQPLAEVRDAFAACRQRDNQELGIHWCLLPGINDRPDDVAALATFCQGLGRVMIHLIPFNPGSLPITRAPTEAEIERFVGWLRAAGLPVRRRITKGRTVMAACGQLASAEPAARPSR